MLFLVITLDIMSGCAKDKQEIKLEEPSNQTAINNEPLSKFVTVQEVIDRHLPKPFNPKICKDGLEFKGKWKGTVISILIQEMKKMGWQELGHERMGAQQYFVKSVNGRNIKIYLLPIESGGPQEENATTYVEVKIVN